MKRDLYKNRMYMTGLVLLVIVATITFSNASTNLIAQYIEDNYAAASLSSSSPTDKNCQALGTRLTTSGSRPSLSSSDRELASKCGTKLRSSTAPSVQYRGAPSSSCPWDLNGDANVNDSDISALITNWGTSGGPADVNGDGSVNVDDLLAVIQHWGPCPDLTVIEAMTLSPSLVDTSGKNNNGTAVGSPVCSTSGCTFSGSGQYVTINPISDDFNTEAGTIGMWVKPSFAQNTNAYPTAIGIGNGNNNAVEFWYNASNDNYVAHYLAGGLEKKVSFPFATLTTNQWAFIAMTWDKAANAFKLYVNGIQTGNTQTGLGDWTQGAPSTNVIGTSVTGPDYWNGGIKNLKIFNRALNDVEIAQLMNGGVLPPPAVPEIGVTIVEGANTIATVADGQSNAVSFGTVLQNSTGPTVRFRVSNTGTTPLSVSQPTLPSGYTLVTPANSSIPADGYSDFIVRMTTSNLGTQSGQISFGNNDSDENPFNFPVTGTVSSNAPEITVSQVNGTTLTNISDGQTSSISFGSVAQNSTPQPTQTFQIKNEGTTDLTITNPVTVPAGYTVVTAPSGTIAPGATSNLVVRMSTANTGTFSGQISFANNDSTENPFNFPVTGTVTSGSTSVTGPEIKVMAIIAGSSDVEIIDGQTNAVNVGTVAPGGTGPTLRVRISNIGNPELTLGTATVSGSNFTITAMPTSPVAPSAYTDLVIRLNSTMPLGTYTATVNIPNNDSNENPFNFTISGVVSNLPPQIPGGPISLGAGASTIANRIITGNTGIVGDNATVVTSLNISNVTINSTNYGIYCGSCGSAVLSDVNITTDPNGGDSYSVRGVFNSFNSSNSFYRSGIKAFRLYGVESGSSNNDYFSGDRMMLGGGYANEWGDPGPFHNFTFTNATIGGTAGVNSIEMYNDTHHVTFDTVNFANTGHISIQPGAHDIVFKHSTNLPQIRLYQTNGTWVAPPDVGRNIVIIP